MDKKGLVFAALGFELFALVIAGIYIGGALDERMGWKGQGFLLVTGLLLLGWMFHFIKLIQKFMKEENRERKSNNDH